MKDRRTRTFFVVGLIVAIVVAVGVSQFASSQPDGLEFVAGEEGFAATAEDHALDEAPLAGYGGGLTGNAAADRAIAGLAGVLITLAVGYGAFWLVRRNRGGDAGTPTEQV
jgi:hypothetical protein